MNRAIEDLYKNKKYDECILMCQEQLRKNPGDAFSLKYASMCLMDTHQYKSAIRILEKIFSINKSSAEAAQSIGKCFHLSGELESAADWYEKSVAINPKLTSALNNLGFIALQNKQPSKSEIFFKKALEVDSTYTNALSGLSEALLMQIKHDECIQLTQKFENTNSPPARVYLNAAKSIYRSSTDYVGALKAINKELETNPNCLESLLFSGEMHMKSMKYDKAIDAYNKARLIDPKHSDTYVKLGAAQMGYGSIKKARHCCLNAIELDKENHEAFALLGTVNLKEGHLKDAIDQLINSINIKPTSGALTNLSLAFYAKKEIEESLSYALKAYKLENDNYDAINQLARVYCEKGELKKALDLARRATAIQIKSPEAYLLTSEIYCKMNKYIEAKGVLEQAMEIIQDNHLISGEFMRLNYVVENMDAHQAAVPWGKYDELYYQECGGKSLIISFGSMGANHIEGEENLPKFDFVKQLSHFSDFDKLFLRDMKRYYYMNGLHEMAPGINNLVGLLNKYIKSKEYSEIITIGSSSGGFAALLYGNLINANKSIAFNPQTALSIEKESKINDNLLTVPVAKYLRERNKSDKFYQKCLNLKNFIPFSTQAEIHFSNESLGGVDKRHAYFVKHDKCKLIAHNSKTHLLAYELKEKSMLTKTISNSIKNYP